MNDDRFSLVDIARSQSLGFVRLNDSLCDLGERLGVPRYWGFAAESFFAGYMGFGSVEIHFRSIKDVVRVQYAELRLSKFKGRVAQFSRDRSGNTTSFEIPIAKHKLVYSFISTLFSDAGIVFYTDANENVSEETTAVIRVGRSLHFYFSGPEPTLEVICIS
jgi:hypothetical protein